MLLVAIHLEIIFNSLIEISVFNIFSGGGGSSFTAVGTSAPPLPPRIPGTTQNEYGTTGGYSPYRTGISSYSSPYGYSSGYGGYSGVSSGYGTSYGGYGTSYGGLGGYGGYGSYGRSYGTGTTDNR